MYLTEVSQHELRSRGRPLISQGYPAYTMRIVNLVGEFSSYLTCPHETMVFYIPRAALNEFTDEAGSPPISGLVCPPGIIDPVMVHLSGALLPAFERPDEVSALFVDYAVLAVCAHLAQAYGGFASPGTRHRGGLTRAQEKRAKEFLASDVALDISMQQVAQFCGLSRGYFGKAFKATTGLTPHQWRQRHRVDQAKAMLGGHVMTIAEIAVACGFADQSHLTRVFSRRVGESPAAWRRQQRGRDLLVEGAN